MNRGDYRTDAVEINTPKQEKGGNGKDKTDVTYDVLRAAFIGNTRPVKAGTPYPRPLTRPARRVLAPGRRTRSPGRAGCRRAIRRLHAELPAWRCPVVRP